MGSFGPVILTIMGYIHNTQNMMLRSRGQPLEQGSESEVGICEITTNSCEIR